VLAINIGKTPPLSLPDWHHLMRIGQVGQYNPVKKSRAFDSIMRAASSGPKHPDARREPLNGLKEWHHGANKNLKDPNLYKGCTYGYALQRVGNNALLLCDMGLGRSKLSKL
jgi:hypothetical protein